MTRAFPLVILLLLLPVASGHGATSSGAHCEEPPQIPGTDGRCDDLWLISRDWTVTEQAENRTDLLGTSRDERGGEVAFGVHNDVAWLEGVFVQDVPGGSSSAVFSTGARLHRIVFDPPLALKDGGELERVIVPGLAWSVIHGRDSDDGGQRVFLEADIPHPGNGTRSPPEGDRSGAIVATLRMRIDLLSEPDFLIHFDRVSGQSHLPLSPAQASLRFNIDLDEENLSEETRNRLDETRARFTFFFDFGGSAAGRIVRTEADAGWTGMYLYRGDAAATLRFVDATESPVRLSAETAPGKTAPEDERNILSPPLLVNVTSARAIYDFELQGTFGYLMDLPEPPETPSPSPTENGQDTPTVSVLLVLTLLLVLVAFRRTEAPR